MASGAFQKYKYEMDNGTIVKIRLQPETKSANPGGVANAEPAGAITKGMPSANVSKSRRGIGIHPRVAACTVTATGVNSVNKQGSTVYIPILAKATAPVELTDGVYNGDTIQFYKLIPETVV